MFPFVYLSETGSSFMRVVLVIGAGAVVPLLFSRRSTWHRSFLFAVAGVLAVRYLWWRATETLAPAGITWDCIVSWSFFALEAAAAVSSLSSFAILARTRDRKQEATDNAGWWGEEKPPRVAVLIATYNEDRNVLERTIIGALALDHPNFDILVLDDGRRDWLKEFCRMRGARYVSRDDNKGAKAGNMNNALRVLEQEGAPDFIAVLDADFVPHCNFLSRTLPLFHDRSVGLVQTPQHFFNADPVQHNLGLSRSYPDEQRFFFDHLQPSRDAWGIAFCCGTSSVVRWSALAEVGGFPSDSITEDFLLTLVLQDRGHRTVYLNEPLSEGLAPEGLKEYITQRSRWCLGLMQIARGRMGPLAPNRLRLRDRWSVADSVLYWTATFAFRLAAFVYPLFYWFFNITVVDASVADVVSYFGVYFAWTLISLNVVSGGLVVPIVNDVSQLLGAIPITRAAWTGLVQPKGHPFSVTAKGGDRSQVVVQWHIMAPFVALHALTMVGLLVGVLSDSFAFNSAGAGKTVILFWSFYNLVVLSVATLACIELPRRERHLDEAPERAKIRMGDEVHRIWIVGLTQNTVRVRGMRLSDTEPVEIEIDGVGAIRAVVSSPNDDGARLLLEPTPQQYDALLRRFYATGDAPGVTQTRYRGLVADLARRLSSPSGD